MGHHGLHDYSNRSATPSRERQALSGKIEHLDFFSEGCSIKLPAAHAGHVTRPHRREPVKGEQVCQRLVERPVGNPLPSQLLPLRSAGELYNSPPTRHALEVIV